MALSSKALQQKRTKKAAKRKAAKKSSSPAKNTLAVEWLAAADAPIADVYTPESLFEIGIGLVWFGLAVDWKAGIML